MSELDDGRLLAWMEGELEPKDARETEARLDAEPEARARVEELRETRRRTAGLLASLPEVAPDLEAARAALRRETTGSRAPEAPLTRGRAAGARTSGRWVRRGDLARAALLVLLLGGMAAAAIPGSPVRSWIQRHLAPPPPTEAPPAAAAEATGEVAARARAVDGRMEVSLHDLAAGEEVRVRWVAGTSARVAGPRGTRFEAGTGRLEAWSLQGPLRVELPSEAASVTLRLDERILMRVRDGRLDGAAPSGGAATGDTVFQAGTPPRAP